MDGYKILGLVGEGSFGRVFKAKRRASKDIVALKIIRKFGRSQKEIISLRSECEIQKHLLHRNIIQMIDSFETDKEIVVVTEFCKRDLHFILSKQSFLTEDAALPIVCDLVSALYYLHSNRVLHRDLKPQNVMITEEGVAKLCDFGFARSMSRGTHVLTSIKGTPLYMAPELIEESPYDHKADLWSLGCIVYEMVVGAPPFSTNSILQLVRMIRFEEVVWPACLSPQCRHLLQGLLVKDPAHRLSWPHLVNHPFLQERVSSSIASGISLPLTKELTSSQALAKESQKRHLTIKAHVAQTQGLPQKIQHILDQETKLLTKGGCQTEGIAATAIDLDNLEQRLSKLQVADAGNGLQPIDPEPTLETPSEDMTSEEGSGEARGGSPLEAEEWLAFLEQSMREVMRGEMDSICDKGVVTMVTGALTNHGATPKVSEYVACLLSLPHIAPGVNADELAIITRVYIEVKVVSSLIFALKLLTNRANCSSSHNSAIEAGKLSSEQLIALERIMVLINQLVHSDREFLSQFCNVVTLLHLCPRLQLLLSVHRVRPRIATDLFAILTHILRQMPENANIVDDCLQPVYCSGFDLHNVLKHANETLQTRVCLLLQFMSQHCVKKLESLWSQTLNDYVELLAYDSSQDLRCAAEDLLGIVQALPFNYNQREDVLD